MNATAYIKKHKILDGNTALVDAVITSRSSSGLSQSDAQIALQAATDHKLVAIAGSLRTIKSSPFTHIIRGMMAVASECIPFQDNMDGFQSVSSNVYMDSAEKIWSLKEDANGKILVRSHVIDDHDEIQSLLNSCSNVDAGTANTRDREFFQSTSGDLAPAGKPADVVTFGHDGQLNFGIVVASHVDAENMPTGGLTVLPYNSESTVALTQDNIIENHGDLVSSESNTEGYAEPKDEFVSASNVESLVSYWKKVYGYDQAFWKKFEAQIRSTFG